MRSISNALEVLCARLRDMHKWRHEDNVSMNCLHTQACINNEHKLYNIIILMVNAHRDGEELLQCERGWLYALHGPHYQAVKFMSFSKAG